MHRLERPRLALPQLCAALLVAWFLTGCGDKTPSAQSKSRKQAVPVTVATVQETAVPVEVHAIGTVEPVRSVAVRSQVEGTVQTISFQEGDEVHPGEVLFQLDPRPFRATLQEAEANLRQAQVQAKNADAEADRYSVLVRKDYVTKEQYDQIRTQAEAANAAVASQRAAVEDARVQLGFTTIRSPLEGRTGSLQVKVGDLVQPNSSSPLVTINELRPALVAFSVPEEHLSDIQLHQRRNPLAVLAWPSGATGAPLKGVLVFVDNAVDPTTGTVLLKARFDNRDLALWPGKFVDLALVLYTREHALVVPSQAVQEGQQGAYVFVVKPDKTVETRPVVAGETVGERQVIETGLRPGETVVTEGQLRLAPGVAVEVKKGSGGSSSGEKPP